MSSLAMATPQYMHVSGLKYAIKPRLAVLLANSHPLIAFGGVMDPLCGVNRANRLGRTQHRRSLLASPHSVRIAVGDRVLRPPMLLLTFGIP